MAKQIKFGVSLMHYGNVTMDIPDNITTREEAIAYLQKRWDSYKNDPENQYARRQCFLRHPHTTNEMRQAISPEDKRWLKENGYKVKERGRRRHLPTVYDDIFLDIPRCWKDRTKQDAQYKWKRKARHKKCRGMYQ